MFINRTVHTSARSPNMTVEERNGVNHLMDMMLYVKQQIILDKALHYRESKEELKIETEKELLVEKLIHELSFWVAGDVHTDLPITIVKVLPTRMVYRLINKLYCKRTNKM